MRHSRPPKSFLRLPAAHTGGWVLTPAQSLWAGWTSAEWRCTPFRVFLCSALLGGGCPAGPGPIVTGSLAPPAVLCCPLSWSMAFQQWHAWFLFLVPHGCWWLPATGGPAFFWARQLWPPSSIIDHNSGEALYCIERTHVYTPTHGGVHGGPSSTRSDSASQSLCLFTNPPLLQCLAAQT